MQRIRMQINQTEETMARAAPELVPTRVVSPLEHGQPTSFRYLKRRLLNIALLSMSDFLALNIGIAIAGLFRALLKGESMIPEWYWAVLITWLLGALAAGFAAAFVALDQ